LLDIFVKENGIIRGVGFMVNNAKRRNVFSTRNKVIEEL
jgi:hypothetical protein